MPHLLQWYCLGLIISKLADLQLFDWQFFSSSKDNGRSVTMEETGPVPMACYQQHWNGQYFLWHGNHWLYMSIVEILIPNYEIAMKVILLCMSLPISYSCFYPDRLYRNTGPNSLKPGNDRCLDRCTGRSMPCLSDGNDWLACEVCTSYWVHLSCLGVQLGLVANWLTHSSLIGYS